MAQGKGRLLGTRRVIAGHFGLAAFVKSRERRAPLWALMLAAVWLDIVFVPLFLAGVETIRRLPGARGSYGTGIIYADYTHSLVGSAFLSALLGAAAAARRSIGQSARATPVTSAPAAGALRRVPSAHGPRCRMSRA